jgi:gluconate 2-dehydrogenase gamma chain
MVSQSEWSIGAGPIDRNSPERLFFTEHEWVTVEAAVDRIVPPDNDSLGAKEAGVVMFIDRYLSSGLEYIYAAADGTGFLKLEGPRAETWRDKITVLQTTYREGLEELDKIAQERSSAPFKELDSEQQDYILELISHAPKPEPFVLGESTAHGSFLQAFSDDGLAFFDTLVFHTRLGYYGDPVYGGNRDQTGWNSIGFPGPKSLKDTMTYDYSVRDVYVEDESWEDLIPHLREQQGSN